MRVASAFLIGALFSNLAAADAAAIVAAGSDTVAPIIRAAADQFERQFPTIHFVIGEGGSAHGVEAVAGGQIALGMCSRKLTQDEIANYPDLHPFPIGYDGTAVIVNASNPIESLTIEQLHDIFSGRIDNWKQLGGEDRAIERVGLDQVHATGVEFSKQLGLKTQQGDEQVTFSDVKKPDSVGHAVRCDTHQDALALVAIKPGSIGYVTMNLAHKMAADVGTIKLLQVNDVPPTTGNVAQGRYPLARPLLLVTKGEPQGDLARYVDFVRGEAGQEIVRQLGYAPLAK